MRGHNICFLWRKRKNFLRIIIKHSPFVMNLRWTPPDCILGKSICCSRGNFVKKLETREILDLENSMKPDEAEQSDLCIYINLPLYILTLKATITTAADNIHKYFFIVFLRK